MKINKYDPAFPTDDYFDEKITNTLPGLTKREYFAALALQGILAAKAQEEFYSPPTLAEYAVECADKLINQLNKPD